MIKQHEKFKKMLVKQIKSSTLFGEIQA